MNHLLANRVIFIFGLLGILVASYLWYEYQLPGSINCPIGGDGCDIVRQSKYSEFFGVSVPVFGILFYVAVVGLAIIRSANISDKRLRFLQLGLAFSGFAYSLYLTYLEAFVIKAYCTWCIGSFIIATVIFIVAVTSLLKKYEHRE